MRTTASYDVRFFSPLAEVPFCGHATIASGVLLGAAVDWLFCNAAVRRRVDVHPGRRSPADGHADVGFPACGGRSDDDLAELLAALRWAVADLDPTMPPRVAYAGAYHPILAAREHDRLNRLDYDVDRLGTLMLDRDWTTIDLVWRETDRVFHARNPFPVGGVYEDPATGAAAAAFGAYLREPAWSSHPRR